MRLHGCVRNADREQAFVRYEPSAINSAIRSGAAMMSERTSQRESDRRNDAKLLTPLLVMALVIAAGILFYALSGHALAAIW